MYIVSTSVKIGAILLWDTLFCYASYISPVALNILSTMPRDVIFFGSRW